MYFKVLTVLKRRCVENDDTFSAETSETKFQNNYECIVWTNFSLVIRALELNCFFLSAAGNVEPYDSSDYIIFSLLFRIISFQNNSFASVLFSLIVHGLMRSIKDLDRLAINFSLPKRVLFFCTLYSEYFFLDTLNLSLNSFLGNFPQE